MAGLVIIIFILAVICGVFGVILIGIACIDPGGASHGFGPAGIMALIVACAIFGFGYILPLENVNSYAEPTFIERHEEHKVTVISYKNTRGGNEFLTTSDLNYYYSTNILIKTSQDFNIFGKKVGIFSGPVTGRNE